MRRELGNRTPCVLIPDQARSPCRTLPNGQPSMRGRPVMPSTVEFSIFVYRQHAGGLAQEWQDSNLQPAALETAALPIAPHSYGSWYETRNAARSRSGRA